MKDPHTRPRSRLAALILTTLSPMAAADDLPIVVDGENRTIPSGSYAYTGNSVIGLEVLNGGRASGEDVHVATSGTQSHAAQVTTANSFLQLVGGALHTTGNGARGVNAADTGMAALLLRNVQIVTEGAGARGGYFANANGRLRESRVETSGHNAVGVEIRNGSSVSLEETTVVTQNEASHGLFAYQGSLAETDRAIIETNGKGSHGILIGEGNATATLIDTAVTTRGRSANAVHANTGSGATVIKKGRLRTEGVDAIAVIAHDGAQVSVRGSFLETTGRNSHAVFNHGTHVSLEESDIVTRGYNAHGVFARGGDYPGKIPLVDLWDSHIVTNGSFGYGAVSSTGARVSLADSTIRTTGDAGHGLHVTAADLTARNTTVSTEGESAYGAIVRNGGNLSIDRGSMISARSAALGLHDPGEVRVRGAMLTGGNGAFAEVDPTSRKAFTLLLEDNAQAIGDIRLSGPAAGTSPDETKLSLSIRGGSAWSGASSIVRDLALAEGGTWHVTGDSRVGSLRNDHGVVAFAPASPRSFGTLTIAGDYEGNEGLFRMRGRLGGDSSPTDRIHVTGNTSGTSFIAVDALDGAGDATADGIRLVQVDGRSDGRFELSGRAVAGAYEYFLHQGSVSQPGDGGWYLRSSLSDPILEPGDVEEPTGPLDPVDPVVPIVRPALLRPETGTYRANQVAALDMFQAGPGAGRDDEPDASRGSAWARFERRHTAFDLGRQVTTTTATNELTLGTDLLQGGGEVESHLGVMAAIGQSDTRGTSLLTRYSARGRVTGAAGGVYGGLRTAAGTYLRGWIQHARFNQRVEGDALAGERYGSRTLTSSIEAGHRWRKALNRDTDVYLEPQAQIVATRLRGSTHTEAGGTRVASRHASGATARLGMRAAGRWHTPGGHVASPYFTGSWLRRLGRLDATRFNDATFADGVPRNAYGLRLGLAMLRNDGWRLWGDVETRFGARRYRRVAGTLGVRKNW